MEKQTKILLGIGAIIAVYLILKPKKAVTSGVAVVPSEEKPQPKVTGGYACPDGTIDYDYTPNGVMSPCVGHKGETPATLRAKAEIDSFRTSPTAGVPLYDAAAEEEAKRKEEEAILKMGGIFGTNSYRSNFLWQ